MFFATLLLDDFIGATYQLSLNDGKTLYLKKIQLIARGGFGDVYLCIDENTGQKEAMKSIKYSGSTLEEKKNYSKK